jgi:hypothetical protein
MSEAQARRIARGAFLTASVAVSGCFTVQGSYERPPSETIRNADGAGVGVDAAVDAAVPGRPNACHPRLIRAVATDGFAEPHTAPPTCEIDGDGILTMAYETVVGCPVYQTDGGPSSPPYRACYFAQNEDLSAFYRNAGMIEARYCITAPLFDAVDVWMDRESSDPAVDGMALRAMQLQAPEIPMSSSMSETTCRTVAFSLAESCGGLSGCGAPCVEPAANGASVSDAGRLPDAGASASATSCAALERVRLRLTTEYCPKTCTETTCVRANPAQIQLLSFTYYPEDCRCASDGDCAPGTFCRKDGIPTTASCWSAGGCRGICE